MEQLLIRPLQVFLSHSSEDREKLQDIYERLNNSGIDVWLSDEKLIPGQDWQSEITKAVKASDVILLFLSKNALTRDGYFHKEIRLAIEVAEQKPDGEIYIVPVRLEDCQVPEVEDGQQLKKINVSQMLNGVESEYERKKNIHLHIDGDVTGGTIIIGDENDVHQ